MRRIVLLTLSVMLTAPVVAAQHLPPPLVQEWPFEGNAGAALRITMPPDSQVRVGFEATVDAEIWSAGAWSGGGVVITSWEGMDDQVLLDVAGMDRTEVTISDREGSQEVGLMAWGSTLEQPSTFTLVAGIASTGTIDGRFVVYGSEGVEGEMLSFGSAGMLTGGDFEPTVEASVNAGIPLILIEPGASQFTMGAAYAEIEVEHALFGWFSVGTGAASIHRPDGSTQMTTSEIFIGEPSGAYGFTVNASTSSAPQRLFWVDVEAFDD